MLDRRNQTDDTELQEMHGGVVSATRAAATTKPEITKQGTFKGLARNVNASMGFYLGEYGVASPSHSNQSIAQEVQAYIVALNAQPYSEGLKYLLLLNMLKVQRVKIGFYLRQKDSRLGTRSSSLYAMLSQHLEVEDELGTSNNAMQVTDVDSIKKFLAFNIDGFGVIVTKEFLGRNLSSDEEKMVVDLSTLKNELKGALERCQSSDDFYHFVVYLCAPIFNDSQQYFNLRMHVGFLVRHILESMSFTPQQTQVMCALFNTEHNYLHKSVDNLMVPFAEAAADVDEPTDVPVGSEVSATQVETGQAGVPSESFSDRILEIIETKTPDFQTFCQSVEQSMAFYLNKHPQAEKSHSRQLTAKKVQAYIRFLQESDFNDKWKRLLLIDLLHSETQKITWQQGVEGNLYCLMLIHVSVECQRDELVGGNDNILVDIHETTSALHGCKRTAKQESGTLDESKCIQDLKDFWRSSIDELKFNDKALAEKLKRDLLACTNLNELYKFIVETCAPVFVNRSKDIHVAISENPVMGFARGFAKGITNNNAPTLCESNKAQLHDRIAIGNLVRDIVSNVEFSQEQLEIIFRLFRHDRHKLRDTMSNALTVQLVTAFDLKREQFKVGREFEAAASLGLDGTGDVPGAGFGGASASARRDRPNAGSQGLVDFEGLQIKTTFS